MITTPVYKTALLTLSLLLPLGLACGDKDGDSGEPGADDEICDDGLDNDGDGQADCADSDCADAAACQDEGDSGSGDDGGEDSGDTDSGDTDSGGDTGEDTGTTEPPPQLWVNEFMASNTATIADESGAFPDWIELFNPNAEAVSLDGWYISDDAAEPEKHALGDTLSVPAGGFLLLWADDDEEDGPRHVSFNLASEGEEVVLTGPDGSTVDVVAFGPQSSDVSAARVPDGGESWTLADPSTPGESNGEAR